MRTEQVIKRFFDEHQYTWKIDGEDLIPTEKDIEIFLDHAIRTLKDEPVGTRLTVGRLIVEKTNKSAEVYILAGEL